MPPARDTLRMSAANNIKHAPTAESYFADSTLIPRDLMLLFRAATLFWKAQPWRIADPDAVLGFTIPSLDVHNGCLFVVGEEEGPGFVFFPDLEDYERAICLDAMFGPGSATARLRGFSFMFAAPSEISSLMQHEVAEHGLPLPSDHLYPVLNCFVGGQRVAMGKREVEIATAALHALAGCADEHPDAFERTPADAVSLSYRDENGVECVLCVPHSDSFVFNGPGFYVHAPTLTSGNPYDLPFDHGELEQLRRALKAASLHYAVGVFCAVASVPVHIAPELWLQGVLGEARLESAEQRAAIIELLIRGCNHVLATVTCQFIDIFVPQFEDIAACAKWARGFCSITQQLEPSHTSIGIRRALTIIGAVAGSHEALAAAAELYPDDDDGELLDRLFESYGAEVVFLFERWSQDRAAQTHRTEPILFNPKIGRNDPCPCASGKKHKDCCALS